jgi:hypothetical protein
MEDYQGSQVEEEMGRRRFGLCVTDEADVVYIRRRLGGQRGNQVQAGEIMRRVCLALTQAAGIPVLVTAGLTQHNRLKGLRRMR